MCKLEQLSVTSPLRLHDPVDDTFDDLEDELDDDDDLEDWDDEDDEDDDLDDADDDDDDEWWEDDDDWDDDWDEDEFDDETDAAEPSSSTLEIKQIDASHKFHALWTACVDKPGYKKSTWRDIESQLKSAGVIRA